MRYPLAAMGSHGRVIGAVLALLAALSTLPAAAQDTEDDRRVELARALFREGVAHADAGRFAEAEERFRRAYAIRATPALSFNLAAALVRLGKVVEAASLLRAVMTDPESPPPLVAQAQEQLETAEARIARLTIRPGATGSDVAFYVDDTVVRTDIELPLDPGAHVVEARRGSETVATREVTLDDGADEELELEVEPEVFEAGGSEEPEPAPVGAFAAGSEVDEPSGGVSGWVWIGAGVLVVGLVVGGLFLAGVFDGPDAVEGNAMPGVLEWD